MTSAQTMEPELEAEALSATPPAPGGGLAVRLHAVVAALFLVAGVAGAVLAAGQLYEPTLLGGVAETSYGRLFPAAMNLLVFGWLTIGLTAVAYHALPRMVRGALAFPTVAAANLVLMAGAVAIGVAAILLGENAGGRLLEMPWYADVPLLLAFAVTAFVLTSTARSGDAEIGVGAWYLVAAPWWLVLSYGAGALPGLEGVPAAVQSAFTSTAVYGLWLAAAGIGAAYYVVSRSVPNASFHPRLGRIGFWSLMFTWAWTAGRLVQYGPAPDWVETVPVAFAAGLVVTVATVLADFAHALRGKWDVATGSVSIQAVLAGALLFVLVPFHALVTSFRSSSLVVRFTPFESAFDHLTVLGAFTLWAGAGLMVALSAHSGRAWGRVAGVLTTLPVMLGALLAAGAAWLGGLQQGYSWLAGVESGAYENFGDGFRTGSAPLEATYLLMGVGVGIVGLGALVLLFGVVRRVVGSMEEAPSGPVAEAATAPVGAVVTGALLLFAVTAASVFAFPAIDSSRDATILASTARDFAEGSAAERGRELYVSEGCWYCHTQEVRAVVTDVGLGPVSMPGDYAADEADLLGDRRVGPDLMHAGSRSPTDEADWVVEHLREPRAERPWSIMPSYRHLTDDDLKALAAFVTGLD